MPAMPGPDAFQPGPPPVGPHPENWIDHLLPSIPIGEQIMVEREGSGKISIGAHGVVGNREWIVPWRDRVNNKTYQDYVGQLLGSPVEVGVDGQPRIVANSFPAIFSREWPFLYCREVEVEGETQVGRDGDGKIVYRRAKLKCKYVPLNWMEKLDVNVQHQSLPGHQFAWAGQDSRRAAIHSRWIVEPVSALLGRFPGVPSYAGTLAFELVQQAGPPPPNVNFAAIVGILAARINAISTTIVPRFTAMNNLAAEHDGTLDMVPVLEEEAASLQAVIATGSGLVLQQSTGLLTIDSPVMQAMLDNVGLLIAAMNTIMRYAGDVLDILQGETPQNELHIASVDALIVLIQSQIEGQDAPLSTAHDTILALYSAVTIQQDTSVIPIQIPVDFSLRRDTNPWDPQCVQTLLETYLGVGNVTVATHENRPLSYDIRIYVPFSEIRIPPIEGANDPNRLQIIATGRHADVENTSNPILEGIEYQVSFDIKFQNYLPGCGYRINASHQPVWGGRWRRVQTPSARFDPAHPDHCAREMANTLRRSLNLADARVEVEAATAAPCYHYRLFFYHNIVDIHSIQVDFVNDVRMSVNAIAGSVDTLQGSGSSTQAGRYVSQGHYQLQKQQIPDSLKLRLLALDGTVNQYRFLGYAPWTLIMMGIEANPSINIRGDVIWTMTFKTAWNPYTWNALYRGETGQYEFVRAIATLRPGDRGAIPVGLPGPNGQPPATIPVPARAPGLTLPDGTVLQMPSQGTGIVGEVTGLAAPGQGQAQQGQQPAPAPAVNAANANAQRAATRVVDLGFIYASADWSIITSIF